MTAPYPGEDYHESAEASAGPLEAEVTPDDGDGCQWCKSRRHVSDACPILALTTAVTGS
jgi:hypothetical protein